MVVILIGLLVAYAGVAELMRMTMPAEAEREVHERHARRTLVATAVVAVVIFVAGAGFVAVGGTGEEPLEIETVGCNGSEALCDQPLDQVAFAAAHNAMSATTNEGFLFGMQDAGFADQLRDGVRALLIDAHYGQPTEGGDIKTDLSDISGPERVAYERELGTEGLEAALRIRDRVVNSPTTGERGVYLCHRFCELGAVPAVDAFRSYRDFLAANPDEVLVIVIEDYVAPEDIEAAVKKSGLIDYVYDGPVGPPWPTLQEMIDLGGRALIMAENDAGEGSIPWYHEVYDELVQETPFRFKKPEALTDRKQLAESCEPNRGPDDAALFLLNHWVDTSPAPKPSNAKVVNAKDVLLRPDPPLRADPRSDRRPGRGRLLPRGRPVRRRRPAQRRADRHNSLGIRAQRSDGSPGPERCHSTWPSPSTRERPSTPSHSCSIRFSRATASGGFAATWAASCSAASSVRAAGATLWTRPQR